MAGNIKGIIVEIGGDTGPLEKALQGVNKVSRDLQSELREVERALKMDPGNVILLEQKQRLLADSIANAKGKLDALKEAEEQVQKQFAAGKVSEEQYRALQREVVKAEQGLNRLEGQALKANAVLSKDDAVKNLKNIGDTAKVAAAAVGAAFVGIAAAAVDVADETQRQADVTGLSAERLQELSYAGKNLGVDLETITSAQAKMIKSMDTATDATKGTGAAFARLGIDVRDSVTGELRDSKVVMAEAITALNGIGNETERDNLTMKIFGKSAMELNPLIKAGGDELKRLSEEAKNNGAVMSNEAVAGLDMFGDSMDNLKSSVLGGVGTMLASFMPQILGIVSGLMQMPQWLNENQTLLLLLTVTLGTVLGLVIAFNVQQALLASGMTLWATVAGVATGVTTALGTAFAFLTSPIGLVILAIGAMIAVGILIYKHWDEIKLKAQELWERIGQIFEGIKKSISNTVDEIIDFVRKNWVTITRLFYDPIGAVLALLYNLNPQFRAWVDSAFATIKGALGNWREIGIGMIDGILEGVANAATRLADSVVDAGRNALDAAKDFLGIHSPSRLFRDQVGAQIGAGMALGISDSQKEVNAAIDALNVGLVSSFGSPTYAAANGGSNTSVTNNSTPVTVNVYDGSNGMRRELTRLGVVMP